MEVIKSKSLGVSARVALILVVAISLSQIINAYVPSLLSIFISFIIGGGCGLIGYQWITEYLDRYDE